MFALFRLLSTRVLLSDSLALPVLCQVTLGVSRLLRDWDFDFELKGPLPVKYDLTLNLDGLMQCAVTPRAGKG
jgi:hypothetical protein